MTCLLYQLIQIHTLFLVCYTSIAWVRTVYALNTCNYIIGEAKMQSIVACCQKKPSIFDWSYETWSCYFYLLHIILRKKKFFFSEKAWRIGILHLRIDNELNNCTFNRMTTWIFAVFRKNRTSVGNVCLFIKKKCSVLT